MPAANGTGRCRPTLPAAIACLTVFLAVFCHASNHIRDTYDEWTDSIEDDAYDAEYDDDGETNRAIDELPFDPETYMTSVSDLSLDGIAPHPTVKS